MDILVILTPFTSFTTVTGLLLHVDLPSIPSMRSVSKAYIFRSNRRVVKPKNIRVHRGFVIVHLFVSWVMLETPWTRNSLGVLFWPFKGKRRFPTCPTSLLKIIPRWCFFLKAFVHPRKLWENDPITTVIFFQLDGSSTKSPLLSEVLKFDPSGAMHFPNSSKSFIIGIHQQEASPLRKPIFTFMFSMIEASLQYNILNPAKSELLEIFMFSVLHGWSSEINHGHSWPGEVGRCLGRHAPCHFAVAPLGHGVRIPRFFFETFRFLSFLVGEG